MPHYQDLWWRLQVLWVKDMCCIQNLKIVLHSRQRHARGAKTSQAYDKFQRRILCWKFVLLGTLATAAEPWALAGAVGQCSFVLIMTYIWETAASVAPAVKILVDVWMSASVDSAIFMKRIVIKVSRVLTKPSNNDVNNEKLGLRGLSGAIWCQDMYGLPRKHPDIHYGDVIMGAIASQITSLTIVYSTVYADADKKNQSSASLVFVRGIHRGPVNSPHKWPVTRKMLPVDDVIMCSVGPYHKWQCNVWNLNWINEWLHRMNKI